MGDVDNEEAGEIEVVEVAAEVQAVLVSGLVDTDAGDNPSPVYPAWSVATLLAPGPARIG